MYVTIPYNKVLFSVLYFYNQPIGGWFWNCPHMSWGEEWKTVCFLYCFLGLRVFCHAVLLFIYIFASKIWICRELHQLHFIHILGFITPNFLPICLMIIAALAIFQVWVGWESSLEHLIQVHVVPLAFNILWLQSHFQGEWESHP